MHVKKNVIKERQLLTEVASPANSTHVLHDIDIEFKIRTQLSHV